MWMSMNRVKCICLILAILAGLFSMMTVQAKNLKLDNLSYSFTTVDGQTLSSENHKARAKILVFGNPECARTSMTLKRISDSEWIKSKDIAVYYLNIDDEYEQDISKLTDGSLKKKIRICDDRDENNSAMWDYLHECGYADSSVQLPVMVYIDGKDQIRAYSIGSQIAEKIKKTIDSFTRIRY